MRNPILSRLDEVGSFRGMINGVPSRDRDPTGSLVRTSGVSPQGWNQTGGLEARMYFRETMRKDLST